MAASAGSLTFILLATSAIALTKQADHQRQTTAPDWYQFLDSGSRELNIQAAIITAGDTAAPPAEVWILAVYRTFTASWTESALRCVLITCHPYLR